MPHRASIASASSARAQWLAVRRAVLWRSMLQGTPSAAHGKVGRQGQSRLLAELSACQAGLTREDLVRATMRLSASNSISLAWQCLTEMGRRNMRASIAAHNALMEAYGRLRRWDLSMRLLLRMQQLGLQPNERSYTAAIRASVGSPGSSKLAETLRPQLEEAARRDAAAAAAAAAGRRPTLRQQALEQQQQESTQALRQHVQLEQQAAGTALLPADARRAASISSGAAAALLSARDQDAIAQVAAQATELASGVCPSSAAASSSSSSSPLAASSSSAFLASAAASSSSSGRGAGIQLLQERLAAGHEPDAKLFMVALSGCARSPGRWREAMQIIGMLEVWLKGGRQRAQLVEVGHSFAASVAACDASRQRDAAIALLDKMERLQVPPHRNAFNAAISACRHDGGDVAAARGLMLRMKHRRVPPDTDTYNALLAVYTAAGGMGEQALQLLREMRSAKVDPDEITYLGVLTACRPTSTQAKAIRKAAASQARRASLLSPPSSLSPSYVSAAESESGASQDDAPPWRRALYLPAEMRLRRLVPNERVRRRHRLVRAYWRP